MSDKSFEVQQALFSTLTTADVADGRIYDHVPQNVQFPYVQVGETDAQPDDLSGTVGISEFVTLHVWSRYRGQKELKQISAAVQDAVHGQDLTMSGRTSALAWVRDVRTMRDPDGLTRHGVIRVEIIHRS